MWGKEDRIVEGWVRVLFDLVGGYSLFICNSAEGVECVLVNFKSVWTPCNPNPWLGADRDARLQAFPLRYTLASQASPCLISPELSAFTYGRHGSLQQEQNSNET